MEAPIIEVKDVYKSFGKKKVLKGLNLDIQKGERVAILGANGCGKSTLVDMIALISKPDSGKIKINLGLSPNETKKEIGIQFQQGEWPAGLSAHDMLKFYRKIYPKFTDEREKELYQVFGISEFAKRLLTRLSGGQKQRFNAMISVLNNPEIIILDELTTGLDMQLQFQIIDYFIKTTGKNHQTLLIVSHHPDEVEALCNRLVIIQEGEVWLDKMVDDVKKEYGSVKNLMEQYFEGKLKNGK